MLLCTVSDTATRNNLYLPVIHQLIVLCSCFITVAVVNRQRVGFNVLLDTLQVISAVIFPTNHLIGTGKQNQTTTKL